MSNKMNFSKLVLLIWACICFRKLQLFFGHEWVHHSCFCDRVAYEPNITKEIAFFMNNIVAQQQLEQLATVNLKVEVLHQKYKNNSDYNVEEGLPSRSLHKLCWWTNELAQAETLKHHLSTNSTPALTPATMVFHSGKRKVLKSSTQSCHLGLLCGPLAARFCQEPSASADHVLLATCWTEFLPLSLWRSAHQQCRNEDCV